MKRSNRRPLLVALILTAGTVGTQCMRQDEVECEEAAAHLAGCCQNFDLRKLDCHYTSACGETFPDLSPSESECILDKSCSQLAAQDICKRVQDRGTATSGYASGTATGSSSAAASQGVCE
ncbi:MAG TPA: hypothetical protein VHE30_07930 [Polyangiaceae bacterium]|nr:hypothetical protein [Polyangiaceae bacterium]